MNIIEPQSTIDPCELLWHAHHSSPPLVLFPQVWFVINPLAKWLHFNLCCWALPCLRHSMGYLFIRLVHVSCLSWLCDWFLTRCDFFSPRDYFIFFICSGSGFHRWQWYFPLWLAPGEGRQTRWSQTILFLNFPACFMRWWPFPLHIQQYIYMYMCEEHRCGPVWRAKRG